MNGGIYRHDPPLRPHRAGMSETPVFEREERPAFRTNRNARPTGLARPIHPMPAPIQDSAKLTGEALWVLGSVVCCVIPVIICVGVVLVVNAVQKRKGGTPLF